MWHHFHAKYCCSQSTHISNFRNEVEMVRGEWYNGEAGERGLRGGGGERLHLVMVSCFKVGALSFMVDIGWNQGAEFKQFNTIGPVRLGGEILTTRIECLVWRAVAPSGHRVGSTLAGPFLSRALFWLLQFWCNKVYSAISCRLVPIQVK